MAVKKSWITCPKANTESVAELIFCGSAAGGYWPLFKNKKTPNQSPPPETLHIVECSLHVVVIACSSVILLLKKLLKIVNK